ncbi:MAG TPA: MarR family transcriptional regulator [Candidatus Dormibacteraeota bacterium]|nr:MarR family transcriptional regulator [Candidatus Dormibacteraeota bacterium]
MKAKTRTADVEQVWEGLARAHASMTAALERDMVPEAGMPLAWYEVLLHLSRSEGRMLRYQDLAKVAGITNSGASRRLEQMTKAGLIERRSCPTDRRGVFAHVTSKGETAFSRAHTVFVKSLERNFGRRLQPGEAEMVSAALKRIP